MNKVVHTIMDMCINFCCLLYFGVAMARHRVSAWSTLVCTKKIPHDAIHFMFPLEVWWNSFLYILTNVCAYVFIFQFCNCFEHIFTYFLNVYVSSYMNYLFTLFSILCFFSYYYLETFIYSEYLPFKSFLYRSCYLFFFK